MIRTPKPICRHPLENTVTVTLMARPLRPNPPPFELNVGKLEKKVPEKVIFFLMARPFTLELCGLRNLLSSAAT